VLGELATAYLIVFLVNVVPAFMPPTWSVLAYFLVNQDLPLLPLALGGAVAASAGRLVLALVSRRWGRRLLSERHRANLAHLGSWLDAKARWAAPVAVFVYSFGPIPSNELFIAAGVSRMRLAPVVGAFFVGRVISYTFWSATADTIVDRVEDMFSGHWSSVTVLALEALALVALVVVTRVDWPRLLPLPAEPGAARSASRETQFREGQRHGRTGEASGG
jgi:membrane protein YqaA with SNARE-associated domain